MPWRGVVKWTLRIAAGLCALIVLISFAMPTLVRRVVRSQLNKQGLSTVAFDVNRATPWGLELGHITSGQSGTIRAGAIQVSYSPTGILRGNIKIVRLIGADVAIGISNGKLDLGTLGALAQPGKSTSEKKSSSSSLPDEIDLVACALKVEWEKTAMLLPLEGTLKRRDNGAYDVKALTFVADAPVQLTGMLSPAGDGKLSARGKIELATLLASLPQQYRQSATHGGGLADISADYAWGKDAGGKLTAKSDNIWMETVIAGRALRIEQAKLNVHGSSDSANRTLVGTIADAAVSYREMAVKMSGKFSIAGSKVAAAFTGSGRNLDSVAIDIAGEDDNHIVGNINLTGTLPPSVLTLARANGIVLDRAGPLTIRGNVSATRANSAWAIHTDDLAIHAGPGDEYLMAGALLSGATADLHVAADVTSDAASIALQPRSTLTASKITSARLAGATLRAALDVIKPPRVQIRAGQWTADFGQARLSANAENYDLGKSAQLQRPSAVLVLSGSATPGKASLTVLDGSTLSALAKAIDGSWSTSATTMRIAPGDLLTLTGGFVTTTATLDNTTTVAFHTATTTATIPHLSLTGGVRTSGEGRVVDVKLALNGASVKNDSSGITADGIAIDWPIHLGEGPTPTGTFSAERIVVGAKTQAAAKGTLAMRSGDAWASLDWPAVKEGSVKASAYINWAGKVTTMDLRAWVPEFDLNDAEEIRKFIKSPGTLDVEGRFAADSRFYYDGTKWTNWGSVHVANAALRNKEYAADLSGINGEVYLNSFSPLESLGNQIVSVKKGTLGKLDVSDGKVAFRIEPGDLFIEQAGFNWGDGRLSAAGFRYWPKEAKADIDVHADGVKITSVVGLASQTKVGGDGKLYGSIPVKVKWPQFSLGEGYLYAGSGVGNLQLTDAGDQIAGLLTKSDPQFATNPTKVQVRDRIVNAMKNFDYDTFRIDLRSENGQVVAIMSIGGKGAPSTGGQGLNLNVRVTGVVEHLSELLIIGRKIGVGQQ
jgi:hypothetical protein